MISRIILLFFMVLPIISCQSSNDKTNNISPRIIEFDWCYPDCDDPMSAFKFNSDGTFNASFKNFGGMSQWGNWEYESDNTIQLITKRISTNIGNDTIPPPQILTILSDSKIQVGNTIYKKG